MEIIMLLGKSRCGKTSTIHKVYEILTKDAPSVIFQEDDGDDFSAILAYKGKKIAFHSLGDFARQVIDAMYEYCNNQYPQTKFKYKLFDETDFLNNFEILLLTLVYF